MQRDLEISAASADLRFVLRGERLPADHGEALADAVTAELPWLAGERDAGIHAVRGAPMQNELLGVSRRACRARASRRRARSPAAACASAPRRSASARPRPGRSRRATRCTRAW